RIGGEPTDEQRAVIDAGSANGSGYCRVAVGEEAAGVDRRLIDGDWSGPGERGLVGGERDIEALPAIARQQRDGAVHAATRQAQVSDYGALTQRQIAGDRGPPDIEPLDPDLYRSAGGHDQVDHAVERAEHRLAFRFDTEAVWSRLKRDTHVLQARGRERAGKDERGARPVIGEGRFDRESPIIDVAAGAGQRRAGIVYATVERQRELAGAQAGVVEDDRPTGAENDRAVEADVRAGDVGERSIGYTRHAASEVGGEPPGDAVADHEADLASGIDRAEVLERDASRLDWAGQRIAAAGDVAAQRQIGPEAGEAQREIVRQQPVAREDEGTLQRAVHQPRIGDGVTADDPTDAGIQRQSPACSVVSDGAALGDTDQPGATGIEFTDRQLDRRSEVAERAVKRDARNRIVEREAGAEQLVVEQDCLKLQRFESVVSKVDRPLPVERDTAATHSECAVENAVFERADSGERDDLAERCSRQAGQIILRPCLSDDLVAAFS